MPEPPARMMPFMGGWAFRGVVIVRYLFAIKCRQGQEKRWINEGRRRKVALRRQDTKKEEGKEAHAEARRRGEDGFCDFACRLRAECAVLKVKSFLPRTD